MEFLCKSFKVAMDDTGTPIELVSLNDQDWALYYAVKYLNL